MTTPQNTPPEASPVRTFSFVSLSGAIHIAAAISILFAANEVFKKPEMTEIEILSSPQSQGGGAPAEVAKAIAAPPAAEEAPAVVKAAPAPKAVAAPVRAAKVAPVAQTPRHEQVEAPNFETAELEEAPALPTPSFDEGMIADDLAAAEQEDQNKTQAQVKEMKAEADQEAAKIEADHAQEVAKIQKQKKDEAEKAEKAQRVQEAKNRAAAAAAALAASEAAAQAKADEDARKSAAAAAAAAPGEGSGNSAQNLAENGGGSGMRGIQDLQQMPGNKRPEYESDDRLKGRQGQVVFTAYVTKDGVLTDFKILKTSGHRNLDLKTLKALKQWKFFPGQEGMVEIPFQWDLKGGPQEMATGLRTKVSQGQRPTELRNSSTESKF